MTLVHVALVKNTKSAVGGKMVKEEKKAKQQQPITEETPDVTLLKLLGSQQAVDEFKRFRDKDVQRKNRKEIEYKVEDILAEQLKDEYDTVLERLNKVYRKAWTIACKELELPEEEYPSKY